MPTLSYQVIQSLDELVTFEATWKSLSAQCPGATVFQSWSWQLTWLEVYRCRPFVICMRDENGDIVAFLPLLQSCHGLWSTLCFIGAPDSDYLDFLVKDGYEAAVVKCFFEQVLPQYRSIALIELEAMPEGSRSRPLLEAGLPPAFAVSSRERICPYISLPDSWEALLASRSASHRYAVRRKERALGKQFRVEIAAATTADAFAERLQLFISQHQERWRGRGRSGAFGRRTFRRFHEVVGPRLFADGLVKLYYLDLDGVPVASFYLFETADAYQFYLSGFRQDYAKFSPGAVLMSGIIRAAIEQGKSEFDMMRGSAAYKFDWTSTVRTDKTLTIVRRGLGPRLYVSGLRGAAAGVDLVKSVLNRLRAPHTAKRLEPAPGHGVFGGARGDAKLR